MKYLITEHNEVIIFSDSLVHSEVAHALGKIGKIRSAGFLSASGARCRGDSWSLGITSDPEHDNDIIDSQLR